MRWFHMALIAILAAAIVIFAMQNLQNVTVAFLNFRLSAPLAVLIAVVYVLGMKPSPACAMVVGLLVRSAPKLTRKA